MKKIIYGTLSLALVGIIFVGCEKVEDFSQVNENQDQVVPLTKETGDRVYYDNGNPDGVEGVDYGCEGAGGTCKDDIVINGNDLFIVQGINTAKDQGVIKTYFANNALALENVFTPEAVNGIINENLYLNIKGNIEANKTAYFQFFNNNNELVLVVPVKE